MYCDVPKLMCAFCKLFDGASNCLPICQVTLARVGGNHPGAVLCSRKVRIMPDDEFPDCAQYFPYDAIVLPGGLANAKTLAAVSGTILEPRVACVVHYTCCVGSGRRCRAARTRVSRQTGSYLVREHDGVERSRHCYWSNCDQPPECKGSYLRQRQVATVHTDPACKTMIANHARRTSSVLGGPRILRQGKERAHIARARHGVRIRAGHRRGSMRQGYAGENSAAHAVSLALASITLSASIS